MSHLDEPALNEYLDSALTPARRAEVERHLGTCRECAARLERMQALFAALDSLPDLALERDLAPGVLHTLRQNSHAASSLKTPFGLLIAGQGLVALVLLAAAIPFAAQRVQLPDLARWSSQTASALSEFHSSALAEWNAALAGAARFFTLLAAAPDLSLPPLPTAGLLLILLAAGILWLVANGVLLKQITTMYPQSTLSRK